MGDEFIVGLDLGELNDFTALAILKRTHKVLEPAQVTGWQMPVLKCSINLVTGAAIKPIRKPAVIEHHYEVVHLWRPELGTRYPRIVGNVVALLKDPRLTKATLAVDRTGVGQGVVDMLLEAKLAPIEVVIHGGDQVHREGRTARVPKRDLVSVVSVALQTEELKIAAALPLAPVLTQELLNFRTKIDPTTAHDSYGCWREGEHDDLLLAVAIGLWVGENPRPSGSWAF